MENYRRVIRPLDGEKTKTADDEIRITSKGRTGTYVSYCCKLFNEKEEKQFTLKATGQAIATAVTVAEVVKRRFKEIHQVTKLGSVEVEDEWEPIEEGLDTITMKRNVSFIEITLARDESLVDKKAPGYQAPIDQSLVVEMDPEEMAKGRGRAKKEKEGDDEEEKPRRKGKGKGKKGKGKGKKGKGKGKGKKGKGKGKGKRSQDKDDDE